MEGESAYKIQFGWSGRKEHSSFKVRGCELL